MEIRHNTQALERVLELVMQRHDGLAAVAHAEALRQIGAYRWQRVLAWAIACTVVAVGIGLAIFLANSRYQAVEVKTVPAPKVDVPVVMPEPPPLPKVDPVPAPAPKVDPAPVPAPKVDPAPKVNPPPIVTTDFTIFKKKTLQIGSGSWVITAGHAFDTQEHQADGTWQSAWCYTEATRDKLVVNFDLGSRTSKFASQTTPSFDVKFAQEQGLSNKDIEYMASQCPWLDGKSYTVSVPPFDAASASPPAADPPAKSDPPLPMPTPQQSGSGKGDGDANGNPLLQKLESWADFDAVGGDIAGMPIWNVSQSNCESQCRSNSACLLATYNISKRACFLKSRIERFQRVPGAVTLYRSGIKDRLMAMALGQ